MENLEVYLESGIQVEDFDLILKVIRGFSAGLGKEDGEEEIM